MELVLDFSLDIMELVDHKYTLKLDILEEERIKKYIIEVVSSEYTPKKPVYISLFLTDNLRIKEINCEHRNKDEATDVISFAYHESEDYLAGPYDTLGDIVISVERVLEQSKEYNHSFEREFYYILTHGLLHLLGYDHLEEEEKKEMRAREEEILEKFGYKRVENEKE